MQLIGNITPTATADGHFTNGAVTTGISPTILDAAWFNTVQDELANLVTGTGLKLDPTNNAQVIAAITLLLKQSPGRILNRQIFTNPGIISYQPSPGTKRIKIILTGGGGRGYGYLAWGSSFIARGAGGGAGGTVIAWLNVDETKSYPGVVGKGSNDTDSATSSTFNGQLTAGNGLNTASGDAGGVGGSAVGGDINIQGGDGSDAPGIITASTNPYRGGSGDGGVSYWGGGSRSGESATSGKKITFGAGGGGNTRSDPFVGNYGSDGIIYIEEYS